ncbi:MAG: ATP-binding protein [Myxococcaceae bacterium]
MKWAPLSALLLLASSTAFAAGDGGTPSCADVEQKLQVAQRTLNQCNENARSLITARDRCEAELDQSADKGKDSSAKLDACVSQKEALCNDAAAMAAALLQGTAKGVGQCVPQATVQQLQALVASAAILNRLAVQLDDYVSGASDTMPKPGVTTEAERRIAHALGGKTGVPLWNRRLLVEAFRRTAPNAWGRVKSQGLAGIDAFFESRGPLPDPFITEANGEHPEPAGPAGPPLTAALRLALSYLELSNCEERAESAECGRARQLVELLDDTGPLIIRRRVEEMYATPCEALSPDTIRAWLQDFPTSRSREKAVALNELSDAAKSKLFHCYLVDAGGDASYAKWIAPRLPPVKQLDPRMQPVVDGFRSYVREGDPIDLCGRAVRAMQNLKVVDCGVVRPEPLQIIALWAHTPPPADASPDTQVCQKIASLMWGGNALILPESPEEQVKTDDENEAAMTTLRKACDERAGKDVEQTLVSLAAIAKDLGEPVSASPWRLDDKGTMPLEKARAEEVDQLGTWLQHTLDQQTACDSLGIPAPRCAACREGGGGFDCELSARVEENWARYRRITWRSFAGLVSAIVVLVYLSRLRRARRVFGETMKTLATSLDALGLKATPDVMRWLFPSRHDVLNLDLPKTPAWERWGTDALAILVPGPGAVREADVNHAAGVAMAENIRVVFLLHPDSSVPDLGAVRAMLDWAARGGTRAVQVLPLALSRLAWATKDEDLLDLVEATTLRGNPFEVRGPVRSSSQFWNRERLVAGLLTETRAGNWVVVTGLRRFGKSSLALEVARRTTGPSAYVDLAGFHHEVSHGESPAVAVEAILKTLVMRLSDSARVRFPAATVPAVPTTSLDAPTLASWLRELSLACGTSAGTSPPPMMLVLDEVEQLLSAPREKLAVALDVMATLTGRLRSALSEPSSPHSGASVSVVLCAAVHPLLWAPLSTLGGQSIMGAFPSICVPVLDDEAAHAMMRGLGSRQGIRFEDDALGALVKASHGVPLLLRRLGTSVLELYDADRARQGSLGAMRIGVEGANEAIRREEKEGSPLRVWVESEIAQMDTTPGLLLRALAKEQKVTVAALAKLVETQVTTRFGESGLDAHLAPAELKRRAQEAASVMVRLLAESKLLEAHGDLTSPDAYSLPDGVVRRILSKSP